MAQVRAPEHTRARVSECACSHSPGLACGCLHTSTPRLTSWGCPFRPLGVEAAGGALPWLCRLAAGGSGPADRPPGLRALLPSLPPGPPPTRGLSPSRSGAQDHPLVRPCPAAPSTLLDVYLIRSFKL